MNDQAKDESMAFPSSDTLRLVSVLIDYPGDDLLNGLDRVEAVAARLSDSDVKTAITGFLSYLRVREPLELQENFTAAFDLRPGTTFNLTYHAFGDNEERAETLARLQRLYEEAGWERVGGELPDYLPLLLEFLAVAPLHAAAPPVRRCLRAMGGLAETLEETAPAYAALLRPLARALGENGGLKDRRSPERKPTFDP